MSQSPEGSTGLCDESANLSQYTSLTVSQSPEGSTGLCDGADLVVANSGSMSQSPEGSTGLCDDAAREKQRKTKEMCLNPPKGRPVFATEKNPLLSQGRRGRVSIPRRVDRSLRPLETMVFRIDMNVSQSPEGSTGLCDSKGARAMTKGIFSPCLNPPKGRPVFATPFDTEKHGLDSYVGLNPPKGRPVFATPPVIAHCLPEDEKVSIPRRVDRSLRRMSKPSIISMEKVSQSPEGSTGLCDESGVVTTAHGYIMSQSPEGSTGLCDPGILRSMPGYDAKVSQSPEGSTGLCDGFERRNFPQRKRVSQSPEGSTGLCDNA